MIIMHLYFVSKPLSAYLSFCNTIMLSEKETEIPAGHFHYKKN